MKRKLTAACTVLCIILCGCKETQQEIIITEVITSRVTVQEASEETDVIPEETAAEEIRSENSGVYVPQKTLIAADNPSKEDVRHMLLNSIDYYNYASGRIAYTSADMACPLVVEFECSIPDSLSVSRCRTAEVSADISKRAAENSDIDILDRAGTYLSDISEIYGAKEYVRADNINMSKSVNSVMNEVITRSQVTDIPDDLRFGTDENGRRRYSLRANPTNVPAAAACLSPQEITLGYLSDLSLWDITGREEYVGRDCLIISGKSSEEYGRQLGTESFVFYIDAQTGCLLKYLGRDSAGEAVDYLISDGISFESSGELPSLIRRELERTAGYTSE